MSLKISLAAASVLGALLPILSTQTAHAAPTIPSDFDSSIYKPMDLNRYCRSNYGSYAYATRSGDHAYDWSCRSRYRSHPIDGHQLCRQQWGSSHQPVLLGVHAYDWACTDWSGADDKVVPVVVVSADYFWDVQRVNEAVQAAARQAKNTKDWYGDEMNSGASYELVRPVVKLSLEYNGHWNDLSCRTSPPADRPPECAGSPAEDDRGILFWEAVDEVSGLFSSKASSVDIIVPMYVFTGDDADAFTLGAAALSVNGIAYNVQPPAVAACDESNAWCGIYSAGHEIGHNFGLDHTCDLSPVPANCGDSIMFTGGNQTTDMLLFPDEQSALDASPFFSVN